MDGRFPCLIVRINNKVCRLAFSAIADSYLTDLTNLYSMDPISMEFRIQFASSTGLPATDTRLIQYREPEKSGRLCPK